MEKFIIIDGNSLANRAFYAMPYLSNHEQKPSGAVFGFANLITKLITEQKPDYIAVAFDHARKTFRNEIYADYKGTRKETPSDLLAQFPVIKQMLDVMKIKVFEFAGIEADDIIGTIAKHSGLNNILVSGDRDLLQLIDDNTHVWLTKKGVTDVEVNDEKVLMEKFSLPPSGIIELKALMGDSSDNIPGVMGVGEKTALSLLQTYGTIKNLYSHLDEIKGKLKEKLETDKVNAFMSKELATIKTDCDIDFNLSDCKYEFPFSQDVKNFFEKWDFRSLANRKDIFAEGVHSEKKDVKKIALNNVDDFINFRNKIKNYFCFDLDKMEFACGGEEIYFVEKEISLFVETMDLDQILEILKPVFENKNIIKITYSSKSDMKILNKLNIKLENFFDLDIAEYMLYAGMQRVEKQSVCDYINLMTSLTSKMSNEKVLKIYNEIEIPLVSVLVDMEEEGFKIDSAILNQLSEKFDAELSELVQKIYELAGEEFNINSPKQVAGILFDKLKLKSYNNKKQSTNFAVLDDMRWQHEIVDLIIRHRKLSKLISTYIKVYENICEKSGPVIHTVFNQTLTSTGRLSSSEPNMQNIPTRDEEGRNLRKIFVSKYDQGEIISADYSQIELRLLANMAEEESMIHAYQNGIDIHTKTASEIFGVPVEKVTQSQRQDAKAVNFGIIYGISDYGLSQNIKTSRFKAKQYMDSYFDRYPKIKSYMEQNIEFAKENGFIKSYFGRTRHVPEIKSSNYTVRKFGERVAMNMPLQGTASDIIKIAMVRVAKRLKGMKSHIILQIHDELIVDAVKDEIQQVKEILKQEMENVCDFQVSLKVSVSSGKNLFDCK